MDTTKEYLGVISAEYVTHPEPVSCIGVTTPLPVVVEFKLHQGASDEEGNVIPSTLLTSFYMTPEQFTSILLSADAGQGGECTLSHVKGHRISSPEEENRSTSSLLQKLYADAGHVDSSVSSAIHEAESLLDGALAKGRLNQQDKLRLQRDIVTIRDTFLLNSAYLINEIHREISERVQTTLRNIEKSLPHAGRVAAQKALSDSVDSLNMMSPAALLQVTKTSGGFYIIDGNTLSGDAGVNYRFSLSKALALPGRVPTTYTSKGEIFDFRLTLAQISMLMQAKGKHIPCTLSRVLGKSIKTPSPNADDDKHQSPLASSAEYQSLKTAADTLIDSLMLGGTGKKAMTSLQVQLEHLKTQILAFQQFRESYTSRESEISFTEAKKKMTDELEKTLDAINDKSGYDAHHVHQHAKSMLLEHILMNKNKK